MKLNTARNQHNRFLMARLTVEVEELAQIELALLEKKDRYELTGMHKEDVTKDTYQTINRMLDAIEVERESARM